MLEKRTLTRRTVLLGGAALAASCAPSPPTRTALSAPVTTSSTSATPDPVSYPDWSLQFVRSVFGGDPTSDDPARWQWQVLQADRTVPDDVAHLFFYVTAAARRSDPRGITQCLPPDEVSESWLLRDTSGQVIRRAVGRDDDAAIDVGNPDFQAAAVQSLVSRCRSEGWTGVMLDEVSASFLWTWPMRPASYPDDRSWQDAEVDFVQRLGSRLRASGFSLGVNIGDAVAPEFCERVADGGQVVSSEFFVEGGPQATAATVHTGSGWDERMAWLERSMRASPMTLVQDRKAPGFESSYGLASFLLASSGAGAYGTSVDYTVAGSLFPRDFERALSLGPPVTDRYQLARGLWQRDFTAGRVVVNSTAAAGSVDGITIAPSSGVVLTWPRPAHPPASAPPATAGRDH